MGSICEITFIFVFLSTSLHVLCWEHVDICIDTHYRWSETNPRPRTHTHTYTHTHTHTHTECVHSQLE